jgi:hypothetical protein
LESCLTELLFSHIFCCCDGIIRILIRDSGSFGRALSQKTSSSSSSWGRSTALSSSALSLVIWYYWALWLQLSACSSNDDLMVLWWLPPFLYGCYATVIKIFTYFWWIKAIIDVSLPCSRAYSFCYNFLAVVIEFPEGNWFMLLVSQ